MSVHEIVYICRADTTVWMNDEIISFCIMPGGHSRKDMDARYPNRWWWSSLEEAASLDQQAYLVKKIARLRQPA